MKNNSNSSSNNERKLIYESAKTLDSVMSTAKSVVKTLKLYQNRNTKMSIKENNMLKRDLHTMTAIYNDICDDTENLVRFLAFIGDFSEGYAKDAFYMIDNKRRRYLDFKRSQPDYIRKLMA